MACAWPRPCRWVVTKAWEPPFVYRVGDVLSQDISLIIPVDGDRQSTANELVHAGEPLTIDMIQLLEKDHVHEVSRNAHTHGVVRSLATFGMLFALDLAVRLLHLLPGSLRLLKDVAPSSATLLLLITVSAATACWAWPIPGGPRSCPVLIFGMTCGIAYKRELALLL